MISLPPSFSRQRSSATITSMVSALGLRQNGLAQVQHPTRGGWTWGSDWLGSQRQDMASCTHTRQSQASDPPGPCRAGSQHPCQRWPPVSHQWFLQAWSLARGTLPLLSSGVRVPASPRMELEAQHCDTECELCQPLTSGSCNLVLLGHNSPSATAKVAYKQPP